jgi:serine protease
MRHSLRFVPLLLAGAALAACDQRTPDLPTGARAGTDGMAPLMSAGADALAGRYIVVLKDDEQSPAAASVAREVTAAHGGRVHHTYRAALNGFAASLSPEAVAALRRDPRVKYVAEDALSYPDQTTQPGATWGLDRVDQRDLPLNNTYVYGPTGAGVRVYVIDSGILTAHNEFGGRASVGTDFMTDGRNGQDCNGHGTHVSGTIGGATYGVAKGAQLIAVRVFPCAGGTATSTIIAAVDWVRLNAIKPAVVNYSGGGGYNPAHNEAVQALIASGLTYVTSAGNDNIDACTKSPASTPEAITVGATESGDARWEGSNWGPCVDVFAPGADITSAWYNSTGSTAIITGTSMAAPHVSGVAALYLQGNPTANAATVGGQIVASSTIGRVTDAGTGSANRLLFSPLILPPAGAVIGLNPDSLVFTFVSAVAGTAGLSAAAARPAARQEFTTAGDGDSRTDERPSAALLEAATAASPILSSRVVLSNEGTTPLEWSATSNQPWLTVDPTGGELNAGYTTFLNATVNASGLAEGTHTGALALSGGTNSPRSLNVRVNVAQATALQAGVPRTGLAAALGSTRFFAIEVPAGSTSLILSTLGGTGDVDLYVRYGDVPTFSDYDCRPWLSGNSESCGVDAPLAGTYYVMLHGYSNYSGVTLVASTGGTPAAPTSLVAVPASPTSIQLTWADGSVNETGFTVSRRTYTAGNWGAWSNVGTSGTNATSFTNGTLTAGTNYQYRIRACNASGCSAWVIGTAVSIPTAAPATPFNLLATATSGTEAAVTWSDGSTDETGFTLARALRNTDGSWGAYATVRSLAANTTSWANAGLVAGRQYRYQLRACNPVGCSPWITSATVVMPTMPTAPAGITGTTLSMSSLRVQWADSSSNETFFTLQRAPVSGGGSVGTFALVATLAPNQVQFTNNGMTVGTYRYRIRACNAAGCSGWTTSGDLVIPPLPAVPGSLTAAALSSTSIRLTWTDGSLETSYQVWGALRNTDGTWPAYTSVATLPVNSVAYDNTGLLSGRAYRYQVRACNVSGCSPSATSVVVTTP